MYPSKYELLWCHAEIGQPDKDPVYVIKYFIRAIIIGERHVRSQS